MNHEVLSTFQAGFVRGKRTLDNVSIIKTIVDKYLRGKEAEYIGAWQSSIYSY
jgi:hypothetical protein